MECFVGGGEDCDVGLVGDGAHYVGCIESTFEGCEVEGKSGIREVGGWDQERVNDLDHAAGKFQVLVRN